MNKLRSRKTDLKKSMDRHGSKQGEKVYPVHGAHEDIGQFVVVISRVWGHESRFWRDHKGYCCSYPAALNESTRSPSVVISMLPLLG